MDAVELPLLAVSKLLTGREGVSAGEIEAREPISSVPAFGSPSVARFSSSSTSKDATRTVTALEQSSFMRNKKVDVGGCMHDGSLPSFGGETIGRPITVKDSNGSLFLLPKCTGKQLQRKGGKPSKSGNLCSKRPRSEQVDGSINQAITIDGNVIFGKHGSTLMECTEKSRGVGQKHNLDGKRGDKRNLKPPSRTKYDPFFSKVGLVNTNSAVGGGNILGMYGLKSDIHDVTKHVDELSLSDLLDGSYKYPNPSHDKGKKVTGSNETLLQTVRMACSILQPQRVVPPQNAAEVDTNSNRNTDACLLNSSSSVTSGTDCSKSNNCTSDLASSSKDSCTPSNTTPLYQPKDTLERLALPPVKDLDSLLLDTSKAAVPPRSTADLRISKPMSYGASLPSFSWSHCFNGSSKTVIDTGKLSTNRSRWVRIGSIASSLGDAPSGFSDLDSITCDYKNFIKGLDGINSHHYPELSLPQKRLDSFDGQLKFDLAMRNLLRAPEAEGKVIHHENRVGLTSPSPDHIRFLERDNKYIELEQSKRINNGDSATNGHLGNCDQHQWHLHSSENVLRGGHSPRLLVAAQTLYEISRHSGVQDQDNGKFRCPKKASQKSVKTRKSRSSMGKTELVFSKPKSPMGPGDPLKISEQITPSKKPKLSTSNKRNDTSHMYNQVREPMKWSIPTSSRSPPTRSENAEPKHSHAETVKHFGMMPSSKRVLEKACNGEQKLRKAVVVDWGRGRSKNEG